MHAPYPPQTPLRHWLAGVTLCVSALLAGCAQTPQNTAKPSERKAWRAVSLTGPSVRADLKTVQNGPTIFISDKNSINGYDGCNSYDDTLEESSDGSGAISVRNSGSSLVACVHGYIPPEEQLRKIIEHATHWRKEGGLLVLTTPTNEKAVLQPVP